MTPRFGVGYRRAQHDDLLQAVGQARPEVLEVMPDHFFGASARLASLAERYPIVLHDVALSLGTRGALADDLGRLRLARLKEIVEVARPTLVSDHLAVTRSPRGTDLGHLLPIWRTREALATVVDNVRALEDALRVPVAVENIAAPFEIPDAELPEPEFFHELVGRCGVQLLLDVSNLVANAHNFGFDVLARLAEYPLERVACVHLAGASYDDAWRVDSHDGTVDAASYRALRALARKATPAVVIVERDQVVPALCESVLEAQRASHEWRLGRSDG